MGNRTQSFVPREEKIEYRVKSWTRTVAFAGQLTLTERETGRAVFAREITDSLKGSATWAELRSGTQHMDRLDKKIRELLEQEPLRPEGEMVVELRERVLATMADMIMSHLDPASPTEEQDAPVLSFDAGDQ